MAPLAFLSFLFFSLFLQKPITAQPCPTSCPGSESEVKFPFGLNAGGNRTGRFSYPGFGLACSKKTGEQVINLPESGEFRVRFIDYEAQQILIDDPDSCLAKQFLQSLNLSGTRFDSELWCNLTFFNCSASVSEVEESGLRPISCLSNQNYSIVTSKSGFSVDSANGIWPSCYPMSRVTVPIPILWLDGIPLHWHNPNCTSCVKRRGDCRFRNTTSREIGRFNPPSQDGLPRSAKYGIIIGIGIPGLLCLIGLVSFVGSRVRTYVRPRPSFELPTSISPSPAVIVAGLDGPTIESYPKTQLGDSGRLPKPNDNTCPICLAEYQPKETLRTIPECNHYFHTSCIDEWLKMNASCPLCRNSPGESAAITPSVSSSSLSSSSLSSP